MAGEEQREKQEAESYRDLLGELGQLQHELQKDVASPSLIDFAKTKLEDISQAKNSILQEVGHELGAFLEETIASLDKAKDKEYQTMARTLTPELVVLLTDIKERAYVYLANKNRQEIAGQMMSTVQGRDKEFAGQWGIVNSILSRAGRRLGPKLETEEKLG